MTVKVLMPDFPGLRAWLEDQRGEWSAQTGGQVQLETVADSDLSARDTDPAKSLTPASIQLDGDILIYPSTRMGGLVTSDLVAKVPKEVFESPAYEHKDIGFAVHDYVITWDREAYALPLSAECLLVYCRNDLFADPENQSRFEQKYGHALKSPTTWSEFDDIAEFFDGADLDGDGITDHGLAISSVSDALLCRAVSCGKLSQNLSFFFDINTGEPLVSGPPFQKAIEDWDRVRQFTFGNGVEDPPLSAFAEGRAALAIGSSTLAVNLLRVESGQSPNKLEGKISCTPIPRSLRAYQHDKKAWLDLPADQPNHSAIVKGLVASVVKASPRRPAAFDFLSFLSNRERSLTAVTTPEFGLGPYRLSHLVDPAPWVAVGWSPTATPSFLATMQAGLNEPNAVALLSIAGSDEYLQVLDAHAQAAFRGEKPPSDALALVADAWRTITERRGVDRQRRQYRYSLGMPVTK